MPYSLPATALELTADGRIILDGGEMYEGRSYTSSDGLTRNRVTDIAIGVSRITISIHSMGSFDDVGIQTYTFTRIDDVTIDLDFVFVSQAPLGSCQATVHTTLLR